MNWSAFFGVWGMALAFITIVLALCNPFFQNKRLLVVNIAVFLLSAAAFSIAAL